MSNISTSENKRGIVTVVTEVKELSPTLWLRAYSYPHAAQLRGTGIDRTHYYAQSTVTKSKHQRQHEAEVKWRLINHSHMLEQARARRTSKLNAEGSFTAEEFAELCASFNWRCAYCGKLRDLTVDHRVPLSKGGTDYITNILPACSSCNSSKHDKTELAFRLWRDEAGL